MPDTTILLPIHRERGNRQWLAQAIRSFPKGTPYLVLENDGELAEALNVGLKTATTEFVVAFGADDVALPGFIDWLETYSFNADVVYPAMLLVSEDLKTPLGEHPAYPFCAMRLMQLNYIAGPSLVRRAKALAVGGYRDKGLEDWDLWVRMWRAGSRFKPCPEAKLLYRQVTSPRREVKLRHRAGKVRSRIVGKPDPLKQVKATWYTGATPATTYVRCQLPARVLPGIVRPDLSYMTDGETLRFHEHHGAAIFQFAGTKYSAVASAALREATGCKVLVEVDDDYTVNPGPRILKRQQWGLKIGDREATRDGHRWTVQWADGVIVTTDYLAGQYRKIPSHPARGKKPDVYVCPNSVDPADWPVPAKPDDGMLRIVWFASQSHEDDIGIVSRAFEWASRQKDVQVWIVGLDPAATLKFKQRWRFPYGQVGWVHDLDRYRHLWQRYDVSVAPISRNPVGLGRSDLKALESAMGLCAPVLMNAEPYASWTDGENCMKASNSEGFLRALKHLVAHREEIPQLAQAAREYVLAEHTNAAQSHLYEEAIS